MDRSNCLNIAQVTDMHLFANSQQSLLGVPTADSFSTLVAQLRCLNPQPDLLLLTGDLSQDGSPESYDRLQSQLGELEIPVYWLPGNHDQVAVMEKALTHPQFSPDKSFQAGGWQFVLLNSQEIGCVHGRLSAESLYWLDRELQSNANLPTLVAFHHPPFAVNSTWLDTSILQNPAELFEVIDRHPQVKLVVFGHIHQEFQQVRNGVTYLGTPSTCIQFEPKSTQFALGLQQPGFRLINLDITGTWNSQIARINYSYDLDLAATGY